MSEKINKNVLELEKEKLKSKSYTQCPICGSIYHKAAIARHNRSKKHISWLIMLIMKCLK